jgi:hypothetical protein
MNFKEIDMPARTFSVEEIIQLTDHGMYTELREPRGRDNWAELCDVVFKDEHEERLYHVLYSDPLTDMVRLDREPEDFYPDAYRNDEDVWVVECPEVELYVTYLPVVRFRKVADVSEVV